MRNPISFEINKLSAPLDWATFYSLDSYPLTYGWNLKGQLAPQSYISLSDDIFWFGLKVFSTPKFDLRLESGEFKEGLWQQDVAELFILDKNQRSYQEINLAPSGAYWSQYFIDYRKPLTEKYQDLNPLEIFHQRLDNAWIVGMCFSLKRLSVQLNPDQISLNITSISESPSPSYHSLAKTKSVKPDFHAIVGGNKFIFNYN